MTKTAGLTTTTGGGLGMVAPSVDWAWDVGFKRVGGFGQHTCTFAEIWYSWLDGGQ